MMSEFCHSLVKVIKNSAVARVLIAGWGGGGGVMGGMCIHIFAFCQTNFFDINLKTTDFKRNSWGITRTYEYTPPPPPINALATALVKK